MAHLELTRVSKRFGRSLWAVSELTLSVGDGEFVILVGPSGCGKSTVLRMIAGLETITRGELRIDGHRMNEVEPQDRGLAMVFQNYALYPHLSVFENLAFPLRLRKVAAAPLAERVQATARALGIEPLLARMPRELSGGQRQRVALGRAMVREPKAFLFDEPLSNLDARLRLDMRVEIAELHQRLGTTFLYVTHDQVEAMTLGQRIVVLRDGRLQQCAAPEDLYAFPANRFVAGFIGAPPMNFIEAELICECGAWVAVRDPFRIRLPASAAPRLERHGPGRVAMGIRPGDLRLQGSPDAAGLRQGVPLAGRFLLRETLGDEELYYIELASARAPRPSVIVKAVSRYPFARQAPVELVLDPARLHLFDAGTGGSLLEVRGQT